MKPTKESNIIESLKKDLPYYFSKLEVTERKIYETSGNERISSLYSEKFKGNLTYGIFYKPVHKIV